MTHYSLKAYTELIPAIAVPVEKVSSNVRIAKKTGDKDTHIPVDMAMGLPTLPITRETDPIDEKAMIAQMNP